MVCLAGHQFADKTRFTHKPGVYVGYLLNVTEPTLLRVSWGELFGEVISREDNGVEVLAQEASLEYEWLTAKE